MSHSDRPIPAREKARIGRLLLKWFWGNQRALPWRTSREAYGIWVSEVMLQQTQVTAVIPFYERFMERFPTVDALAQAEEQEVLRAWEGLGYYRRARHLHQAARVIVQEHGGQYPQDAEVLSELPGFGRYTVGAVLSQAFGQALPIVDANVARVLCRLFSCSDIVESKETQAWLWETAGALVPRQHPGDFNQAMMELGQTICKTGSPDCLLCPLRDVCMGHAKGLAGTLPRRRSKARQTAVYESAYIVRKGKRVLLGQRPTHAARWANMWEFPTITAVEAEMQQFEKLTGCQIKQLASLGSLPYGITRFRVTLAVYEAIHAGGKLHRSYYQQLKWVQPGQLEEYPLSVPHRRLAKRWLVPT